MPTIGAQFRKWTPLLLLCSIPIFAQPANETSLVQSSAPIARTASNSPSTNPPLSISSLKPTTASSYAGSTCPFRTINYITHTLPQQCLKTSWSAPTQVASTEVSDIEGGASPSPSFVIPNLGGESVENGSGAHLHSIQAPANSQPEETGFPDTVVASDIPSSQPEADLEAESPFDNDNFLSFEEWKKKNLVHAGQSPEGVGQGRAASSQERARRRPVDVNALDSLGDESEIEIDFSGFGNVPTGEDGPHSSSSNGNAIEATKATGDKDNAAPSSWALSKDAGKTCKERFNYASFDCAATVLQTNKQAKSSSSVLVEHKDSYMLNECSANNKFVIVEMCDDILVDTIVLANYEFFSSMFRHFRVSVSDRYPVKIDRWRTIGTFEAHNSRDIQAFLVTEPQIWARYLRIEFLTHYGNEYYCPLSLVRVHGTTMMEQFRRDEEEARGDDDFTEPIEAAEGEPIKTAGALLDDGLSKSLEHLPREQEKETGSPTETSTKADNTLESGKHAETLSQPIVVEPQSGSPEQALVKSAGDQSPGITLTTVKDSETKDVYQSTSSSSEPPLPTPSSSETSETKETKNTPIENGKGTEKLPANHSGEVISSSHSSEAEEKQGYATAASSRNTKGSAKSSAHDSASASSGGSSVKTVSNSTANGSQAHPQSRTPSQTQPNPGLPTTQESFFKLIHKRLQHLEANSTLSLQYIEEQSRSLRDAFIKVEKRQLSKTEKFLDHLNSTVMQELKAYRGLYDQMWQSTIMELESMKERQRSEIGEIGTRLSLVADELVWQKRMAVVQSTLLLLCLGLVLFVRSGTLGSQPDVPIAQKIGHKYSQFFDSPPGTPGISGSNRRKRTFRNIWRSDTSPGLSDGANQISDAETYGNRSPAIESSPLTPETPNVTSRPDDRFTYSLGQASGTEFVEDVDSELLTPTDETAERGFINQAQRTEFLETQSGPATPNGTRDCRPSWEEVDRAVDLLKAEEQGNGLQRERELNRERRKKISSLRRAESYDGPDGSPGDDDDDDNDNGEAPFIAG